MKQMITLIYMGLLAAPMFAHPVVPGDSIGKKIVDGKAYVMLKVTKGDNLGAIARQYNSSVENLRQLNKLSGEGINIGQVLLVPARGKSTGVSLASATAAPVEKQPDAPAPKPAPAKPAGGDPKKHTVAAGESLFAVARTHGVSVEQIKRWNNLTADGLRVGQVLLVSDPGKGGTTSESNVKPNPDGGTAAVTVDPGVKEKPGVHVVKAGETLYGIARLYGMDARDLKVLNKIEDPNLKVGQTLRVRQDPPSNANQGTELIEMISATSAADSAAVKEGFTDLKVLTAAPGTMIAPEAKTSTYKDKASGKTFKRVEEEGTVGVIDDYVTDQTKFYAFHRYLPVGSYIRIDYPEKGQSILAEVTNQLPARDPHVVRLSSKCLDYLMIRQPGAPVRIRYVIPAAE
jgi:LysM repeat protein